MTHDAFFSDLFDPTLSAGSIKPLGDPSVPQYTTMRLILLTLLVSYSLAQVSVQSVLHIMTHTG